ALTASSASSGLMVPVVRSRAVEVTAESSVARSADLALKSCIVSTPKPTATVRTAATAPNTTAKLPRRSLASLRAARLISLPECCISCLRTVSIRNRHSMPCRKGADPDACLGKWHGSCAKGLFLLMLLRAHDERKVNVPAEQAVR